MLRTTSQLGCDCMENLDKPVVVQPAQDGGNRRVAGIADLAAGNNGSGEASGDAVYCIGSAPAGEQRLYLSGGKPVPGLHGAECRRGVVGAGAAFEVTEDPVQSRG